MKIQIGLIFLVQPYPGCYGNEAAKRLSVCHAGEVRWMSHCNRDKRACYWSSVLASESRHKGNNVPSIRT